MAPLHARTQRPTCAVCDHDAGAPTAPLRRPAYRNGRYLCNEHAAQSVHHEQVRGRPELRQADADRLEAEQREAALRRHPPQQGVPREAPAQGGAPSSRGLPQGNTAMRLPRTAQSGRPHQGGAGPRGRAPEQGTERPLAPTQGARAPRPPHVASPSHAPEAPPTPPIVEAPPQVPHPADDEPVVG